MLQFGQYKYAIDDANRTIKHDKHYPAYGYLLKCRALLGLGLNDLAQLVLQLAIGKKIKYDSKKRAHLAFTQQDADQWF